MKTFILCGLLLSGSLFAAALSDAPTFQNAADSARYQQLIKETRCPTCQNSDIGESNAPLARQLRAQIAKHIQAGKSNAEITEFLRLRYGDFITYNPPVEKKTFFLWFAPFLLMLATLVWFFFVKRQKTISKTLSATEEEQLQQWIKENQA